MHILLVEDDPELSEKLCTALEGENYTVERTMDGADALERIWNDNHDLILLDIMLPELSGFEVLQNTREAGISTPVLMLTARGDVSDKVQGLNLGADDYLAKPFSLAELLARIRALLRRGLEANPVIQCGEITLNTVSRIVTKKGSRIVLTPKEFSIFEFLLHNRGRVLSRFVIAEHVWGEEFDPFVMSNVVNVHIKNLRQKLHIDGQENPIKTIRGTGYVIEKL
jgi:DNA-binding response OmpR family regulator